MIQFFTTSPYDRSPKWDVCALTILLVVLTTSLGYSAEAQDSFEWTGNATTERWTDSKNWNPNGDPNGSVNVLFPKGSKVTLDASRTVGLLDLRGEPGQAVQLSGSRTLQVQSGMNWDETILEGQGSLIALATATFEGIISIDQWTLRLSQNASLRNSDIVMAGGSLDIPGTLKAGPGFAGIRGTGLLNIDGTLSVNNTPQTGLPESAVVSGNRLGTNHRGVIDVIHGTMTLENTIKSYPGASFETRSNGTLIIRTDFLEVTDPVFRNENRMEIQLRGTAADDSIQFSGNIHASGSQPVIIRDIRVDSQNATFSSSTEGGWQFSGEYLSGSTVNTGSFIWRGGDLNKPPTLPPGTANQTSFTQTSVKPKHLQIVNEDRASFPITLSGTLDNRGDVVQTTTLTLRDQALLKVTGKGVWELQNNHSIIAALGSASPTFEVSDGGELFHLTSREQQHASIATKASFDNASLRLGGGTLALDGESSFNQSKILLTQPGSELRLNRSSSIANTSIQFDQGNCLQIRSGVGDFGYEFPFGIPSNLRLRSQGGVILLGLIKGIGNGKLNIDSGTLVVPARNQEISFPAVQDPSLSASSFEINKSNLNEPALLFSYLNAKRPPNSEANLTTFFRAPQLTLSCSTTYRSGIIEMVSQDSFPLFGPGPKVVIEPFGLLNISSNGRMQILDSGTKLLRRIILENNSTINHIGGNSSRLELESSRIINGALYELSGDGAIRFRGNQQDTCFENQSRLTKTSGTGTSSITVPLKNTGKVTTRSGTLQIALIKDQPESGKTLSGGEWSAEGGGKIRFNQFSSVEKLEETRLTLKGERSAFLNKNGQPLFQSNRPLELRLESSLDIRDGASLDASQVDVKSGATLEGTGTVNSPEASFEAGSLVAPGASAGTLTFNGNLRLMSGSVYHCEFDSNGNDTIVVNGIARLGGTLQPGSIENYQAQPGTRFLIVQATAIEGTFDQIEQDTLVAGGYRISLEYTDQTVEAVFTLSDFDPYKDWTTVHFGEGSSSGILSRSEADPDEDGIPNLVEFSMGTDPNQSNPYAVSIHPNIDPATAKTVEITLNRHPRSAAFQAFARVSTDLESWQDAPMKVISSNVIGELTEQRLELTLPVPGAETFFLRVGFEQNLNPIPFQTKF